MPCHTMHCLEEIGVLNGLLRYYSISLNFRVPSVRYFLYLCF